MLQLFDVNYASLASARLNELYSLRKGVFKDRLKWAVSSINDMEMDEYDNQNTTYIFGVRDSRCICSVRFIEIAYPNMITGTFRSWFDKVELPPGNFVEASRLFVDKERMATQSLRQQPVSALLFLSMINYARHYGYEGIYAIVSHQMYVIFRRSGWQVSIVEQSAGSREQRIYLIFMPVDVDNQRRLISLVSSAAPGCESRLESWPISFTVGHHGADKL